MSAAPAGDRLERCADGRVAEKALEDPHMADLAQQNMDAVRRFLAAINRDDLDAMCAELDEHVKWRTPVIHGVTPALEFKAMPPCARYGPMPTPPHRATCALSSTPSRAMTTASLPKGPCALPTA